MSCGRDMDTAQGKVSEGTPLLQAVTVVMRVLTLHRELLLSLASPSKYVLLSQVASVTAEAIARIPVEGISIYPEIGFLGRTSSPLCGVHPRD
jgi:hypothetical protein